MVIRRVVPVAALVAACLAAGCVTEGGGNGNSTTDQQIRDHIADFGTLRGQEYVENEELLSGILKDRALPFLVDALGSDASARVRAGCAMTLAISQDGKAREPLARAAQGDSNDGVRYTAAYALCLFRDARGLPVLFQALHSESQQIRWDSNERLKRLTNLDFGYDASEAPERRDAAAARWEGWYREVGPERAAMRLVPQGGAQ